MIEPPFVYLGSKFKVLPQLLPLFPPANRFVDLFAGAGAVWSNVLERYPAILANDIIGDLIEIQRKIIHDPAATLASLEQIKIPKDDQAAYVKLRCLYNEEPTPERLLMLMLTCTNNAMRFNKKLKFNQTFGKRTMSERSKEKILNWAAAVGPNKEKVQFSSMPFQFIQIQDGDFLFVDPPYSNSEAGYNAYWGADDDIRLFTCLKSLDDRGFKFMLCGFEQHGRRNCWLMEAMAESGFLRTPLASEYEKVSRARQDKQTQEVVYTNYSKEQV